MRVHDLGLGLHAWAPSVLVTAGDACLVDGGNTSNQVAYVSHLLASHRVLVLGHGKHPETPTGVTPSRNCDHPRQL